MKTGITVSKTRKRLSTIVTATGSVAIIGLSAAFITNDFNGMLKAQAYTIDTGKTITALEPIRSDAQSEQIGDRDDSVSHKNENSISDTPDIGEDPNTNHSLPCFDPDCSVHHNDDIDSSSDISVPPADVSMETIKFLPDSCEYVDKDVALKTLATYVDAFSDYFEKYSTGQIYLVGGIAKTANWSLTDTELSKQRADTVRRSFIELGIDDKKLISVGLGVSDPWRSDEWETGYFNEEVAKMNRRVWIIPDEFNEQVNLVLSIDAMIDGARNEN